MGYQIDITCCSGPCGLSNEFNPLLGVLWVIKRIEPVVLDHVGYQIDWTCCLDYVGYQINWVVFFFFFFFFFVCFLGGGVGGWGVGEGDHVAYQIDWTGCFGSCGLSNQLNQLFWIMWITKSIEPVVLDHMGYTLCSGVHVCWSEHSDSSFVYGFMILDYGFGTMTATTYQIDWTGRFGSCWLPNRLNRLFWIM